MSAPTPAAALLQLLDELQPGSILCCSLNPPPVLHEICRERGIALQVTSTPATITEHERVDLALVSDLLEHVDKATGTQLLAGLRNAVSSRIWVLVDTHSDWQFDDFLCLGFHRQTTFTQETSSLCSYGYDLNSYNHKRSWNNASAWANPQNWGKYWW